MIRRLLLWVFRPVIFWADRCVDLHEVQARIDARYDELQPESDEVQTIV